MTQTEVRQKLRADIKTALENLVRRMDREVPESGDFAPVLEFFDNPDPQNDDSVGRHSIQIYKMRADVVADPRKRYMEVAVYLPGGLYKMDAVVASGTNDEIREQIARPDFLNKLVEDFGTYEKWVRISQLDD